VNAGVAGSGVIVYAPVETALAVKPAAVAIALMLVLDEMGTGPMYFVEEVAGVVPSIVK
jgi:hypothetical protein